MTRFIYSVVFAVTLGLVLPGPALAQVGKSVTISDANLVIEAELAKLPGLNAAIAKALVAQRPFASVTALEAFLTAQRLTRPQITDLYGRIFVHVNLNAATDAEILLIPGVGPNLLREFKEYRPFASLAVFRREFAKYVNATEVARLEQYVFLPIKLNTATDADILTIPGLGARMLREFKEYRPYAAIDVFRREMGKYVSKEEVARLERFVTVN